MRLGGQVERLAQVVGQQVDIRRESEYRGVVPEPPLNLHGVGTTLEQHRRGRVPERVPAGPGDASLLDHGLEHSRTEVAVVQRSTIRRSEREVVVAGPVGACPVLPELADERMVKRHLPPPVARFRRAESALDVGAANLHPRREPSSRRSRQRSASASEIRSPHDAKSMTSA